MACGPWGSAGQRGLVTPHSLDRASSTPWAVGAYKDLLMLFVTGPSSAALAFPDRVWASQDPPQGSQDT